MSNNSIIMKAFKNKLDDFEMKLMKAMYNDQSVYRDPNRVKFIIESIHDCRRPKKFVDYKSLWSEYYNLE